MNADDNGDDAGDKLGLIGGVTDGNGRPNQQSFSDEDDVKPEVDAFQMRRSLIGHFLCRKYE